MTTQTPIPLGWPVQPRSDRWVKRTKPGFENSCPTQEEQEDNATAELLQHIPLYRRKEAISRQRTFLDYTIPAALDAIVQAIEKSRRILDFQEDWDGEGSLGYKETTWDRMANFLYKNALALWNEQSASLPVPAIHHGPEGSIDVYWRSENITLVVNIPAEDSVPATYYGKNLSGSTEGKLDSSALNQWLFMWLMK